MGSWGVLLIPLALAEDPLSITASDRDIAQGGFGTAAAAGDWDGDGQQDLAISAPSAYDGGNDSGVVYVGDFSGGELSAALMGLTPQHNGQFGWALSSAGDVDQDGFEDLLVGAPTESGDSDYEGVAWLFLGSATGLVTSPEQQLNASLDSGAAFGFAMAGGFDSDGDGNTEVAVGAANEEGVYWFETDTNRFDLERMRTSETELDESGYGWALAAGDFDGDGLDDLAVGARHVDEHTGAVFVHDAGALGGIAMSSTLAQSGARFGAAVGNAGDVNGDGYPDLVVGALGDSQKFSQSGAVYLYLGASIGPNPINEYLLLPYDAAPEDQFGARVGGSDLDGDGYSEVVASAPPANDSAGTVHLFPGSSSGPEIGGEVVWTADDTAEGDELGAALLGLVDLDGDGVDDLLVGAPGDDDDKGSAWLIWGCRDQDLDGLCSDEDCDDADEGVGEPLGWYWIDDDGDGFGDPGLYEAVCFSAEGYADNGDDCDDADASVSPEGEELVADGVDSDCDGQELCYDDDDGDSWRDETVVVSLDLDCEDDGEAEDTELDCNDADPDIHPGADEIPGDGIDQDCDGEDMPGEDTAAPDEDPDDPEGCGCGTTALGPWILALLLARRRR